MPWLADQFHWPFSPRRLEGNGKEETVRNIWRSKCLAKRGNFFFAIMNEAALATTFLFRSRSFHFISWGDEGKQVFVSAEKLVDWHSPPRERTLGPIYSSCPLVPTSSPFPLSSPLSPFASIWYEWALKRRRKKPNSENVKTFSFPSSLFS